MTSIESPAQSAPPPPARLVRDRSVERAGAGSTEVLLKAEALQSAIFNSANFSSIATDAKGVIQIFNVGAERMLGYAAAEVMNKITPADISDPQEVIARAKALSHELGTEIAPGFEALVFKASRGIEDIYELTYIRKDRSRFPALVSVTALRDAQDAIIGFLLIGTDNTARKEVEAARALLDQRLRDQQFYTRSLIESNIDALMTIDPQGVISDVNQQMIALTGRSRDELIGAPCRDFFTDPARADAAIKRVLTENKVSNYELTVRARNGEETVVSYNAATFHNRDRKLQGVVAAARDVTEQKKASQYARSLIEASQDPLVTISPDGKITDVNEATIKVTGVTRDGLIGTDFCDYFTEPDEARSGYQAVFAKGFVTDFPLTIRHKDGRLADVLYNASVYKDARGAVLGVVAAARDVSEQKQASRELQRSNAALDEFASVASHDLQEPLRKILAFGERLSATAGLAPASEARQHLERMLGAAARMRSLINDLLAYSQVTRRVRVFASTDLAVIAREVIADLETVVADAGGRVEVGPLPVIEADAFQMRQLLQNLLGNALKYRKPDTAPVVQLRCSSPHGGLCTITVSDNGIGFNDAYAEKIFKMFERLHGRTQYEGSGIGLAICRAIVDRHRGTITARSTPGQGATFTVTLPVTQVTSGLVP